MPKLDDGLSEICLLCPFLFIKNNMLICGLGNEDVKLCPFFYEIIG